MKYHKIQTVFQRDPETKFKTLLEGEWSVPAFEYLQHNKWVFTEKVDGTNIRVMWDGETLRFGGRTDNAQIPTLLYDELQNLFDPFEFGPMFLDATDVVLFGEGYGAKIQKGGGNYIADGVSFVLFDVWIGSWLERENVEDIADKWGIGAVPIIGEGTLTDMIELCRSGFVSEWGNFTAEGIVARPAVELNDRMGHRVITKIKTKDFPA